MKNIRKVIKIMLLIVIAIGVVFATLTVTGIYDPDNMIIGDNSNVFGYGKGRFYDIEFETIEEALRETTKEEVDNYSDLTLLYQATTERLVKVFLLYEDEIRGYEFYINANGTYSYSGGKDVDFSKANEEKRHDWKTTVLSDVSNATSKGYKKFVKPRETYGVLPAWGVLDSDQVKNMTIDGQSVDHIIEFTWGGDTYYLWIIDDLQTENNAVDIVIDVKEEQ